MPFISIEELPIERDTQVARNVLNQQKKLPASNADWNQTLIVPSNKRIWMILGRMFVQIL